MFDNAVSEARRADLWALTAATPALDWLLLTKRPQNIVKMLPVNLPNVWLRTSVENEAERQRRLPILLAAPARIHFLSCEPLLEPVDLAHDLEWQVGLDHRRGRKRTWGRPSHPGWARLLRDQCAVADVPFFFEQWGTEAAGDDLLEGTLHHAWPATVTH